MSKRQVVLTKNFFKIFGRLYTCNIYMVTIRPSELAQPYIYNKFDPIQKISDLQKFHTWLRYLTIKVKHSYITKSVCVLFH